jgi:hypothetical protein
MIDVSSLTVESRRRLERLILAMPSETAREAARQLLAEKLTYGRAVSLDRMSALPGYDRRPVSMRQFLEDPEYMGGIENLRPIVKQDLIDLFDTGENYVVACLTGSIGWGKSTAISFAFAYMIYLLSCMESPAEYFGLMRGSEVFLINQSVNLTLAKKVLFGEIKAKIKQSPYFRQHFPPGPFESQLVFPKNVTVLPLASGDTSALGLNVFGGCIDEINFQPKVRGGVRSRSVNEVYDAGKKMFDAIYRRLKSRFMKTGGFIPGKVMVVSSSQYEDDFTEEMRKQARTDRTIFFRSHSLWESRTDLQSDSTFKVEIEGALGRPRILTGDESPDELTGEVIEVPSEFRLDFEKDLIGAVPDIAGRPTSATDPFLSDASFLRGCIDSGRHVFSANETTLQNGVRLIAERLVRQDELGRWQPLHYPKVSRYAHIDYALSNDECGIAVGCAPHLVPVERRDVVTGAMETVHARGCTFDSFQKFRRQQAAAQARRCRRAFVRRHRPRAVSGLAGGDSRSATPLRVQAVLGRGLAAGDRRRL